MKTLKRISTWFNQRKYNNFLCTLFPYVQTNACKATEPRIRNTIAVLQQLEVMVIDTFIHYSRQVQGTRFILP